ncbi:hypothetical protein HDG34_003724 [Paraburkholderia sp. HC6.4b]|nr:hypothetical protein [Paraburkholderia sp. HC6.4b]MBB5451747.1 hypothetical protein [Paraburkholderia sp. Kb1A]
MWTWRSSCIAQPESAHERGYDAAKKVEGLKRHIAADTNGWLLMFNLTPADIAGNRGAHCSGCIEAALGPEPTTYLL